ncbi:MAG: PT domain-containing protein [Oscillospiraceae bacterium]|nr:PT domain-containing protein [Oscillospiraceae bacterium]
MKKFASVLLSVMLVVAMCAVGGFSTLAVDDTDHTYFVVGSDAVFDPSWTPNEPKYQMTKGEDGIYRVTVPVSEDQTDADLDYKVAQDGAWDVSYNDRGLAEGLDTNAHFYIEEGVTALIFSFDPTTECASCTAVKGEQPTEAPTAEPTEAPTAEPTEAPTAEPTDAPTAEPTDAPTVAPTDAPTAAPTDAPTEPGFDPSADHTYTAVGSDALFDPAWDPTAEKYLLTFNAETGLFEIVIPVTEDQTDADADYKVAADGAWDFSFNDRGPATGLDSNAHLYIAEGTVAVKITFNPQTLCTNAECLTEVGPTDPTVAPTEAPTAAPTEAPTAEPTDAPTVEPTDAPTVEPTDAPTVAPSDAPTEVPSVAPPKDPSEVPTEDPSGYVDIPTMPSGVPMPMPVDPTSATQNPTKPATPDSPTSATNPGGGNGSGSGSSTSTGKVATGDSAAVAILLSVLVLAGAGVVVARKRIAE